MTHRHRSGTVEIRPDERLLLEGGRPVALGARAFDLLLALIEHRRRVVSQDELLDLVWPGLVVEPNNLQVQVSALRKILGPQAIATVPGRGYRFTMPLEEDAEPAPATPSPAASAPSNGATRRAPALVAEPLGREQDLATLDDLLNEHRLLTVIGAGGIGKTTLALAAAQRQQQRHADGIAWVELTSLADASLLPGAVARAVGMPVSAAQDPLPSLCEGLRPLKLLLVLDSAEHLLDMAARLSAQVLLSAPHVRLLVTSQAPLKIDAERIYRLGPLSVPPEGTAPDEALRHGAVALFAARAAAADRRFALTPANVADIIELCRRLDGIPLALQLAAARLPHLGLPGLVARLTEGLHLLRGGGRDAPSRQQTLRAALDWSHGLLDGGEQAVMRRLGVFAGGFTLEMAGAVAGEPSLDEWAVIDAIGSLVDRSLVALDGADEPRYRLPESARDYARLKLDEAQERDLLDQRHARAVALAIERSYDEYWSTPDRPWLARWAPEIANVRAALAWSSRHDPALAMALAGAASPLYLLLGLAPELRKACGELAPWAQSQPPGAAAARFWLESARLNWGISSTLMRDQAMHATELYRAALAASTAVAGAGAPATDSGHDARGLYMALRCLVGSSALPAEQAQPALDEMARLERPEWPPRLRAQRMLAQVGALRAGGRLHEACLAAESLLTLASAAALALATSAALSELASLHLSLGNAEQAMHHARSLADSGTQRSDNFVVHAHAVLVQASLALGRTPQARSAMFDFIAASRVRDWEWFDLYADLYALLAASEGRLAAAARLLGYADAAALRIGGRVANGAAARASASALLEASLAPDNIAALMQQGARADIESVCLLTLAQAPE